MLGQAREVQVGAVIQNSRAGGNANRTAQVAHQVEQPRSLLQTRLRQRPQGQGHRGRHRQLLGHAAQGLGQQQLFGTPVMGDGREVPHRQGEQPKAGHHDPAQVHAVGQEGIQRDRQNLEHPRGEHRQANVQGAVTTDAPQKQWRQVDGGEQADTGDEREEAAQGEIAFTQGAQVHHRVADRQRATDERQRR